MAISNWIPEFDSTTATVTKVMVWIRLKGLNMVFFEKCFILPIASMIGHLIKIDVNTAKFIRGRFARVSVEIDLKQMVVGKVCVQGYWHEGLLVICSHCKHYEIVTRNCVQPKMFPSKQYTLPSLHMEETDNPGNFKVGTLKSNNLGEKQGDSFNALHNNEAATVLGEPNLLMNYWSCNTNGINHAISRDMEKRQIVDIFANLLKPINMSAFKLTTFKKIPISKSTKSSTITISCMSNKENVIFSKNSDPLSSNAGDELASHNLTIPQQNESTLGEVARHTTTAKEVMNVIHAKLVKHPNMTSIEGGGSITHQEAWWGPSLHLVGDEIPMVYFVRIRPLEEELQGGFKCGLKGGQMEGPRWQLVKQCHCSGTLVIRGRNFCEEDLAPDLGTVLTKTPISQKEERKKTDKDYRR
ncbi:hypothetical protein Lal_00041567 [Lupinus albus]|nr:hypothetical protein Lal_00041567 [Lupinus albus]